MASRIIDNTTNLLSGRNGILYTSTGGGGGSVTLEANDFTQALPSSGVIRVVGDQSSSTGGFNQKRSGLSSTAVGNQLVVMNTRDVSSYVVGDPTIYSSDFFTIQDAIDQAMVDGVDVSANQHVQILIRPGVYPDPVTVDSYAIHLIGLGNGNERAIKITGLITYNGNAPHPKFCTNLMKGIYPAAGITANTNPQGTLIIQDCFIQGDFHMVAGTFQYVNTYHDGDVYAEGNVEFTATNSFVNNTFLVAGSSVTVRVYFSNFGNILTQTPVAAVSGYAIIGRWSNIGALLFNNDGAQLAHNSQVVNLDIEHCIIGSTILYGQLFVRMVQCFMNGQLTMGDVNTTDDTITYGIVKFIDCVWTDAPVDVYLRNRAPDPVTPQRVMFMRCQFAQNGGVVTPELTIHDISAGFTAYQTVEFDMCLMYTPIKLGDPSGQNAEVILKGCVCDVYDIIGAPSNNSIFIMNSAGSAVRLVTLNNVFTLFSNVGFVVDCQAGTLNWVNATVGSVFSNTLTTAGTNGASLITGGGTVNQIQEGYSAY